MVRVPLPRGFANYGSFTAIHLVHVPHAAGLNSGETATITATRWLPAVCPSTTTDAAPDGQGPTVESLVRRKAQRRTVHESRRTEQLLHDRCLPPPSAGRLPSYRGQHVNPRQLATPWASGAWEGADEFARHAQWWQRPQSDVLEFAGDGHRGTPRMAVGASWMAAGI